MLVIPSLSLLCLCQQERGFVEINIIEQLLFTVLLFEMLCSSKTEFGTLRALSWKLCPIYLCLNFFSLNFAMEKFSIENFEWRLPISLFCNFSLCLSLSLSPHPFLQLHIYTLIHKIMVKRRVANKTWGCIWIWNRSTLTKPRALGFIISFEMHLVLQKTKLDICIL